MITTIRFERSFSTPAAQETFQHGGHREEPTESTERSTSDSVCSVSFTLCPLCLNLF
jgi:hypothetical protein